MSLYSRNKDKDNPYRRIYENKNYGGKNSHSFYSDAPKKSWNDYKRVPEVKVKSSDPLEQLERVLGHQKKVIRCIIAIPVLIMCCALGYFFFLMFCDIHETHPGLAQKAAKSIKNAALGGDEEADKLAKDQVEYERMVFLKQLSNERLKEDSIELTNKDLYDLASSAIEKDDAERIRILERKGFNTKTASFGGKTALEKALNEEKTACVDYLISTGHVVSEHRLSDDICFAYAVQKGDILKIRKRALAGENMNHVLNKAENKVPLYYAIKHNHRDIAMLLAIAGASSKQLKKNSNVKVPEYITDYEYDERLPDWWGKLSGEPADNALGEVKDVAEYIKKGELIKLNEMAHTYGTDFLKIKIGDMPAICYAATQKKTEIFKYLFNDLISKYDRDTLEKIADDKMLRGLYHYAVLAENIEMLDCLFKARLNINPQDLIGETPLHYAIKLPLPFIAEELLKHGAEIDFQDIKGRSPLHLAAIKGNVPAVKLLLANGANPNLQDKLGNTPLHYVATKSDFTQMIEAFYEYKKDLNFDAINLNGKTPRNISWRDRFQYYEEHQF